MYEIPVRENSCFHGSMRGSGQEKYRIAMAMMNRFDRVLRVLKLLRLCASVNGYPT